LRGGPDKRIPPSRRGTPVVPAEARWIIKRNAPDATSASLRRRNSKHKGLQAFRLPGK